MCASCVCAHIVQITSLGYINPSLKTNGTHALQTGRGATAPKIANEHAEMSITGCTLAQEACQRTTLL